MDFPGYIGKKDGAFPEATNDTYYIYDTNESQDFH